MKLFLVAICFGFIFLSGCASVEERANQYCASASDKSGCINNYLISENRKKQLQEEANSVLLSCLHFADSSSLLKKVYVSTTCNSYGSQVVCKPDYITCRDGAVWQAAFDGCVQKQNTSINNASLGPRMALSLDMNSFCRN